MLILFDNELLHMSSFRARIPVNARYVMKTSFVLWEVRQYDGKDMNRQADLEMALSDGILIMYVDRC